MRVHGRSVHDLALAERRWSIRFARASRPASEQRSCPTSTRNPVGFRERRRENLRPLSRTVSQEGKAAGAMLSALPNGGRSGRFLSVRNRRFRDPFWVEVGRQARRGAAHLSCFCKDLRRRGPTFAPTFPNVRGISRGERKGYAFEGHSHKATSEKPRQV